MEKTDEVVVINSSQANIEELDSSHVSVVTVGEETTSKETDLWKNKVDHEINKPVRVPIKTMPESNKIKMNGGTTVMKSNEPSEVTIVLNNSKHVTQFLLKIIVFFFILL